MKSLIAALTLSLMLTACESATQTTSGEAYLAKYKSVPVTSATGDGMNIEQAIRKVAAVEPVLKFPARIGLARLDAGRYAYRPQLTAIPAEEAEAWKKLRDKLGAGFGEFVPVNPLVAKMVSDSVNTERGNGRGDIDSVINEIRLGAARQHLDAVFIYEVFSKEDKKDNILAIANVTILCGFILPSESREVQGFADGMLIDVVQGYPYGTLQTVVDKQTQLSLAWGWGPSRNDETFADKVKTQAARQLSDEAYDMFLKLRTELAEKRAK